MKICIKNPITGKRICFFIPVWVHRDLPIDPNLWRVRNRYWKILHTVLPELRTASDNDTAVEFVKHFLALGEQLNFARKHLQA